MLTVAIIMLGSMLLALAVFLLALKLAALLNDRSSGRFWHIERGNFAKVPSEHYEAIFFKYKYCYINYFLNIILKILAFGNANSYTGFHTNWNADKSGGRAKWAQSSWHTMNLEGWL
jgi:ABC-type enterochelin transport system permease subunit